MGREQKTLLFCPSFYQIFQANKTRGDGSLPRPNNTPSIKLAVLLHNSEYFYGLVSGENSQHQTGVTRVHVQGFLPFLDA